MSAWLPRGIADELARFPDLLFECALGVSQFVLGCGLGDSSQAVVMHGVRANLEARSRHLANLIPGQPSAAYDAGDDIDLGHEMMALQNGERIGKIVFVAII